MKPDFPIEKKADLARWMGHKVGHEFGEKSEPTITFLDSRETTILRTGFTPENGGQQLTELLEKLSFVKFGEMINLLDVAPYGDVNLFTYAQHAKNAPAIVEAVWEVCCRPKEVLKDDES